MELMDSNETNLEKYSSFELCQRKIKLAYFKNYYLIIKSQFNLNLIYIVILIFEALQIQGLILINMSNINYDTAYNKNIQPIISVIKVLVLYYPSNDFFAHCIYLYINFAILITINLLIIYSYLLDWKAVKEKPSTIFFIYLIIYLLQFRIFLIPSFINYFSNIQSTAGYMTNFPTITMDSTIVYVNYACAFLSFVMLLLFIIANILFFNDNRPVTKIPWGAPISYATPLLVIIKLVLIIFYVFDFGESFYIIKTIIIMILTMCLLIIRIIYPLSHNRTCFNMELIFEESYFFSSICPLLQFFKLYQLYFTTIFFQLSASIAFGMFFLMIIKSVQFNLIIQLVKKYTIMDLIYLT